MHFYTRTQSCVVCPVAKMRPVSGVLLLLLTCQLVTPTPIFDRDGINFHGRSSGFGETIRDWFKVLKERIVGKWQEWFGRDSPTPSLSAQDILNIDKSLESRISGYPGLFLDLFTGNDYKDSDSDEWDMRPFLPNLPSSPDWIPDFRKLGFPEATKSPMTTPKIESTTLRRTTQAVTQTQSVLTSIESTVTTTEAIVTSTESTPLTTQLITTSVEPIAPVEPIESEEILSSSEFVITNREPITISSESTLTSTEPITELTIPSIESTMISVESISTTEPSLTSVRSIETSIESTVINTDAVVTSTEELTTITTTTITESPITSTELILPIFNKRVEENETVNKRTTKKPRPASAEVIMF